MLPNGTGTNGPTYTIVSGTTVPLTATLTAPFTGTDGEMVIFRANGISLGSGNLSNGVATLTTSALPIGTDNITAQYIGDGTYAASVSSSIVMTVLAPAPTFTPAALTFPLQVLGTTSASMMATLTNTANAAISITSITATGAFAQTNNCGSTLAANASCAVTVTFVPTAAGGATGAVVVLDSAQFGTATLNLSGSGAAPAVPALSPATVGFGGQSVSVATAAQTVTLANSASGPLAISSIAATGDFSQTNNCPATLPASATCSISIVFTPTATGSRTGTLTVTDNAATATQTVALMGTGYTAGAITPSTPTLTPPTKGGTTTTTIGISAPPTYTGPVTVACSVAYQGSGTAVDLPKCVMSPAAVTISAPGQVVTSTLTVSTTAASSALRSPFERGAEEIMAAGLLFLAGFGIRRRSGRGTLLAVLMLAALGFTAGCGGGGSGNTSSTGTTTTTTTPDPGTTSGNYQITVTSTAGSSTSSSNLTMTVQ